MNALENDIATILITKDEIDEIENRIAEQISEDYADKNLLLLCILKGSVVFFSDLMRKITLPMQIDFMKVTSYGKGSSSTGNVRILLDLHREDFSKVDVLIVEDIIDSGRTLSTLVEYLKMKGCRSVRTCTLLDKPARREVQFTPDYTGRLIPDEFVVGFGLDYAEKYRELPYVGILKPSVYTKNESMD
ncbi:MAG: hypoxanthine phosphoribosyltransferase [Clostridia bacterium]|nr:hypoxanthine phosphoribosyltransferase [Clostridia bacterium]